MANGKGQMVSQWSKNQVAIFMAAWLMILFYSNCFL